MFSIIKSIGEDMNRYIRKNLGPLEAKEICSKYSTEVIASCAFGIKSNCFESEDADFRKIGRAMFDFNWRNGVNQAVHWFSHSWAKAFKVGFFEPWVMDYLNTTFWDTIKKREESNVKRNDLVDILINTMNNKELLSENSSERDKVIGHAIQIFLAGFETTSSTIAFTLYELCIHPDMQDKLRNEIITNIKENNGIITYEGIQNMNYLDMCVKETLRKYPVLPFLDRRCNKDYQIPGTNVVIERGMPVLIPMLGLHYDEKYFPEPDKYDPERFADKNSINVNGLYYVPFGEGPRICIGERFGLIGTKVGLVHILSEFVVERTAPTPVPIEFAQKSFILQSKVGIPVKFKEYLPEDS
ncbi:hypothetical protein NQ317_008464 [Molorchus minor]|uniref:Cytochrome P450 n=1 Tax=Molorchus minor TaxID=1323400 RepID=A0ABQ9JEA2_9CUCU|nr:hypothetical protein NQ317_008464 [Molorchus minor]